MIWGQQTYKELDIKPTLVLRLKQQLNIHQQTTAERCFCSVFDDTRGTRPFSVPFGKKDRLNVVYKYRLTG